MGTRWQDTSLPRGDDYDARWATLAAAGKSVHGEADLVANLLRDSGGTRVLDAGCGTGRVAIELAKRGFSVVGIDSDAAMLDTARTKAPELSWVHADLVDADAAVGAEFDVVVAAGNVMIFLTPGTERAVVGQLADRLAPGRPAGFRFSAQHGPTDPGALRRIRRGGRSRTRAPLVDMGPRRVLRGRLRRFATRHELLT